MSDLVPVKLLPAGANRTQLMKVIGEKTLKFGNEDYVERIAGQKAGGAPRERARSLLAIENASEIAKTYLHAPGMFEKIMEDAIGTRAYISYQIKNTNNNLNTTRKKYPKDGDQDFILLTHKFQNRTGHTGLLHVEHQNGKVTVYDSMYGAGGSKFENVARKLTKTNGYPKPMSATTWNIPRVRSIFGCKAKVTAGSEKVQVQPSGGFVTSNYNNFTNTPGDWGATIRNKYGEKVAKGAFRLSQYDELSQHHFCYMEALYAMMLATNRDSKQASAKNPGPNDPRKRISFIKKFIWGIIHKYTPKSKRNTAEWKYFSKTFPYIMTTTSKTGKTLRLFRGTIQLPDNDGLFGIGMKAMSWKGYDKIDERWSIEDVIEWVHTGRSPRGNRNANSNSNNNNATRSFRRPTKNNMNSNNSNSNSNNNNNRKSNSNSPSSPSSSRKSNSNRR